MGIRLSRGMSTNFGLQAGQQFEIAPLGSATPTLTVRQTAGLSVVLDTTVTARTVYGPFGVDCNVDLDAVNGDVEWERVVGTQAVTPALWSDASGSGLVRPDGTAVSLSGGAAATVAALNARATAAEAFNPVDAAPYIAAPNWASGVTYTQGQVVQGIGGAAGRLYMATISGRLASSGTLGPTHTTNDDVLEVGGSVTWRLLGPATTSRANAPTFQVVTDANILTAYPTLTQLVRPWTPGTFNLANQNKFSALGNLFYVGDVDKGVVGRTGNLNADPNVLVYGSASARASFITDSPVVAFNIRSASQGSWRILMDGIYIYHGSAGPLGDTGGSSGEWLTVDCSSVAAGGRRMRRWEFQFIGNQCWAGLRIDANAVMQPADPGDPLVAWFGDSIFAGAAANDILPGTKGANIVGSLLGWELWNFGIGGTGFINAGSFITIQEAINRNLSLRPWDAVVIQGGGNESVAQLTAGAAVFTNCLNQIRAARPAAPIIYIAPFSSWSNASDRADGATKNAAYAAAFSAWAATDRAAFMINPQTNAGTQNWQSGEGTAPSGTGNAAFYSADQAHPNQAGMLYLSRLVVAEIRRQWASFLAAN